MQQQVVNQYNKTKHLAQLMTTIGFTPEDLASNLANKLSSRQKKRLRTRGKIFVVLWAVLLTPTFWILLFTLFGVSVSNRWVIGFLCCMAVVAIGFGFNMLDQNLRENRFSRYTGPAYLVRSNGLLCLVISGHYNAIPEAAKNVFLRSEIYTVYTFDYLGSNNILSITPSGVQLISNFKKDEAKIAFENSPGYITFPRSIESILANE